MICYNYLIFTTVKDGICDYVENNNNCETCTKHHYMLINSYIIYVQWFPICHKPVVTKFYNVITFIIDLLSLYKNHNKSHFIIYFYIYI